MIGAVLCGKYRLDDLLGAGGTASVYRGSHRNGNRVAVKVLHAEYCWNTEVRARFLKEAYIANAIDHRGAVRVLDDDVAENGAAFLVMDLLEGETVADRWERSQQRMPVEDVAQIVHEVLDVLAAAHAKNIVHRDLKPANLFVTRDGDVKVLDFGIARMRDDAGARDLTRTGRMVGTPAFMPPEQALGAKDIDARTDVWSVGATMFTLLSGRFVHEAETPETMIVYSATRNAPPLVSVAPGVPAPIAAVVDRALAFERNDRFPDARSMQAALGEAYLAAYGAAPQPVAAATTVAIPFTSAPFPTLVTPIRSMLASTSGVSRTEPPPAMKRRIGAVVAAASVAAVLWLLVGGVALSECADARARPHAVVAMPPPPSAPLPPPSETAPPPPAPEPPVSASAAPAPPPRRMRPICDPPWTIDPVTHSRRVKPGC